MAAVAVTTQIHIDMSKAVRWRGSFADIKNTKYTVEVYGDSDGNSPKEITLGGDPIVTAEEMSDYFDAVRHQTGTLNVLDPDGTLMDEMMPADDTDHPVIVKRGDSIVWQGFLSCEAYSQPYSARTHIVTFNLLSVVAALDSVEIAAPTDGILSMRSVITRYLNALPVVSASITCHQTTAQPRTPICDVVYVQTESIVERVERYTAANNIIVSYRCKPFSEVVGELSKLLGMTVREYGSTINLVTAQEANSTSAQESLVFMGDSHTKTMIAPARSISIEANLQETDSGISIPDTPTVPALVPITSGELGQFTSTRFLEQQNLSIFNNISLRQVYVVSAGTMAVVSNPQPLHTYMGYNSSGLSRARFTNKQGSVYAGATFVKNWYTDSDLGDSSVDNNGIYAVFFTDSIVDTLPANTPHIIQMTGGHALSMKNGKLHISFDMSVAGFEKTDQVWYKKWGKLPHYFYMYLSLRIGNKYYGRNESGVTGFFTGARNFNAIISSESQDIVLTVPSEGLSGDVELLIYPYIGVSNWKTEDAEGHRDMPTEIYFSGINVSYRNDNWSKENEKSNTYYTETQSLSRDSVDVSLEYASDRGNVPCCNIIVDQQGIPLSVVDGQRPEQRLLGRMSTYYSRPRTKLELITAPSTQAPHTKRITASGKMYLIASEECDWAAATSHLTLLETAE